jgi:outer membrane murein-binding lipoprotein Lpp
MAELTIEVFEEKMDSFAKGVEEKMDSFARIVKEGFDSMGEQIADLKVDVSALKVDVAEIKADAIVTNKRIDALTTSVDGFVKLHQTLDIELVALRDKYNRLSRAHNELATEHGQLAMRVARLEGVPA